MFRFTVLAALFLALGLSATGAMACPKGTHMHGGTGAHHKGGKCS